MGASCIDQVVACGYMVAASKVALDLYKLSASCLRQSLELDVDKVPLRLLAIRTTPSDSVT